MLAQIDAVPGVVESRCDRSGRFFLVTADRDVEDAVLATLPRSRRVDEFPKGHRTYARAETIELSRIEARTLAERYAKAANEPSIAAPIEAELMDGFEAIHAGRLTLDALRAEWMTRLDRAVDKSGLGETRRASVKATLRRRP